MVKNWANKVLFPKKTIHLLLPLCLLLILAIPVCALEDSTEYF